MRMSFWKSEFGLRLPAVKVRVGRLQSDGLDCDGRARIEMAPQNPNVVAVEITLRLRLQKLS